MDLPAREEELDKRLNAVVKQLCLVPAYSLSTHKSQSLSIKHQLIGSVEGIFALGQAYVFFSRTTDPQKIMLVGVPPKDLVEDVAQRLISKGVDVDKYFEDACTVTGDWVYDRNRAKLVDRFQQRYNRERSIPLKRRSLVECLKPQPQAHVCQGLAK